MDDRHYDVIVIGSGPGGGSLAQRLALTGKTILMLERGEYLPRSRDNWDATKVFVDGKYQAPDTWYGKNGESFHPGLHYWVGGNSKVYGSALFRFREEDFKDLRTYDGLSHSWPVGYDVFEPYYTQAEQLFHVHGKRGEDPTEPWSTRDYFYPPVTHEPRIEELNATLEKEGLYPFHLPLGILIDERDGKPTPTSPCIRCDTFDGFPCAINAKADSQVICVDPTLASNAGNFTLLTGAFVSKLTTNSAGTSVTGVHVTRGGVEETYSADIVVVACGALSSALLLLRSANDKHTNGLANGSDQVGRNYMRHNMSVLMAVLKKPNLTGFQKTLAVSDFYLKSKEHDYPLGLIQMCAKSHAGQVRGEEMPKWASFLPEAPFEYIADHSLDFWLQTEDLALPENRVRYEGGKVVLSLTETNQGAADGLKHELEKLLSVMGAHPILIERSLYLGKGIPINGTAHQSGTCRFGSDPKTSVLDLDCKAHELDNLYITDASFFPSIGAVNPTLTIVANALRVADHIKTRLHA